MTQYINQYLTALADLTMEMAPYLLLGFFFAGILSMYGSPQRKSINTWANPTQPP